jgi:hypothetical protein
MIILIIIFILEIIYYLSRSTDADEVKFVGCNATWKFRTVAKFVCVDLQATFHI